MLEEDILSNELPISETFIGAQGEGPEAGKPTMFVRCFGCNMNPKCYWCDSSYSWQGMDKLNMSIRELGEEMRKNNTNHFTFTGGEFTLYDKFAIKLMSMFRKSHFSLETNGLQETTAPYNTIVISPKRQNYNEEVLKKYAEKKNTFFKFVYEPGKTFWWENLDLPKEKIYIMSEGIDRQTQIDRMPEVIEYCVKNNYKFSPRIHVLAYDKKRKV